jgi:predicted membrane protein
MEEEVKNTASEPVEEPTNSQTKNEFRKPEVSSYGSVNTIGGIIVVIGLALLLKNFHLLPWWLFQWHTFLIVIGAIVGLRTNFRTNTWLVLILIGVFFTLQAAASDFGFPSSISFPILLLLLGFYLILKPKQHNFWQRRKGAPYDPNHPFDENLNRNSADFVNAVNIFGGSQQIIYTKNLSGGELTSIFGGGDVNFSQADFEGEVILHTNAVFGGIKLIIPPHWQIRSEVTAIFGGVDDKRGVLPIDQNPNKTIVLRGTVLFGGLEIKSF